MKHGFTITLRNPIGKKFDTNGEVIAAKEAYFTAKEKSFYTHGIEKLEKRWRACIAAQGDYVDE